MDAEQQAKIISEAIINGGNAANSWNAAVLVLVVAVMGLMVIIVCLSLVFVVLRLLAVQSQFINAMTTRSVVANEQIRQSTDLQTTAMMGQTNAISAINATGIATGAAVAGVDRKTSLLLGLAEIMGVDIKNLAIHEVAPTAVTQAKVEAIAEKPAGDTAVGRREPKGTDVVPTTPQPGDEIKVVGTVTGTMTGTVAPAEATPA